jgi:NitT/TauT family transport system permease protein
MSVDVTAQPTPPAPLSEAELAELTVTRTSAEPGSKTSVLGRTWAVAWPKLLAVAIVLAVWQAAVLSGWKPDYILPSPATAFHRLWLELTDNPPGVGHEHSLWEELAKTMTRGLTGFAMAIGIGTLLGIAVVQWRTLRLGIGSLIAGLQTMPSIAWFPLAIAFFGLHDSAILFVLILGAAPSVAAGVISGIDEVPPPLLRAGKMIGARGLNRYRYIVLPAAMPSYMAGLKQGWAFAWRSLLAGELLVPIGGGDSSLGGALKYSEGVQNGQPWLLALMIVILVVGMVMDAIFGVFTRQIRNRRGLTGMA